jgi:hypothetical protein
MNQTQLSYLTTEEIVHVISSVYSQFSATVTPTLCPNQFHVTTISVEPRSTYSATTRINNVINQFRYERDQSDFHQATLRPSFQTFHTSIKAYIPTKQKPFQETVYSHIYHNFETNKITITVYRSYNHDNPHLRDFMQHNNQLYYANHFIGPKPSTSATPDNVSYSN